MAKTVLEKHAGEERDNERIGGGNRKSNFGRDRRLQEDVPEMVLVGFDRICRVRGPYRQRQIGVGGDEENSSMANVHCCFVVRGCHGYCAVWG